MKDNYDVIIVGGGPTGSMSGIEIAKLGYSVCILEKTRDIGYPVRCGEAVGHSGLLQFMKPQNNWIASKIMSIKLVSPNEQSVNINFNKETGYILNRRIFDYDLSKMAVYNGAEVYTKAYVKGLIKNNNYITGVKVDFLDQSKNISAKIVIGADGIDSRVARWAGIRSNVKMKDMESCIQYTVSNIDIDNEQMVMHVGSNFAPGGYLWIFPKGKNVANIGIGISGKFSKNKSAKKYLDEFLEKNYPNVSILTTVCGGVPCSSPMKNPVSNGVMLAGDAGRQINPMTGGGIISGMKAGMIAGQVAGEALQKNDFSQTFLNNYTKRMFKDFGKNYERFYKIKEAVNQLKDSDLDSIAKSVLSVPLEKRTLSTVFKKAVFKKPSLIIDVIKVFSGL